MPWETDEEANARVTGDLASRAATTRYAVIPAIGKFPYRRADNASAPERLQAEELGSHRIFAGVLATSGFDRSGAR
jgi:hypothetical protein